MWSSSDALLARYLAGDCTDAEVREIERRIAEDPAYRAQLAELRTLWQTPWPPAAPNIDAMWAGIRRTMRVDGDRSARFIRVFRTERQRWWRTPAAAAAAVLLLGGISFSIFLKSATAPVASVVEPMREYKTPRGQRATFQLADGTRLVLAAASRLRVPAGYGHGVREVYLEGEALFDVVHDSTRPFRVRAKDAVVEDLGTRFDVRTYADDSVVAVAVAEGSVALGRAETSRIGRGTGDVAQGVLLEPGDLGTLAPDGRVTIATGPMVKMYFAWAEGHLHFVNTPLPEALQVIGRWYDLDIRLEGPALAARTVTADFGAQPADQLVHALASAVNARVSQSGKLVTFRSKP